MSSSIFINPGKKFVKFTKKNSKNIAHNVQAVGDIFAARIRAWRSKDQGWQNVPE
jgi:hypothetical protein